MHLRFRNVNDAFHRIVHEFHLHNQQPPRTYLNLPVVRERYKNPNGEGEVLRVQEPVLITYQRPTERVLLNEARDANPFFHLYEALWMLAGRNDVAPLNYYTSGIGRYSDDGVTMNGAYGYRWRSQWNVDRQAHTDQLDLVVNHLRSSPESRRAVLTMWNVGDDLLKMDMSKDVCCNLNVMFALRKERGSQDHGALRVTDNGEQSFLDMTVTNRSNDAVLGLLGANYVHFTILQEYLAARLGAEVGLYHHFTNNLHVYLNNKWKPEEWLAEYGPRDMHSPEAFDWDHTKTIPLVEDDLIWEDELAPFVDAFGKEEWVLPYFDEWDSIFLYTVAAPALAAFRQYKNKEMDKAFLWASRVKDDAWRLACTNWLKRRQK